MDDFFKADATPASTPPPQQPDQNQTNDFFTAGTFVCAFKHALHQFSFFQFSSVLKLFHFCFQSLTHVSSFDCAGETDGFVSAPPPATANAEVQSVPSNEDFTRENVTGTSPPQPPMMTTNDSSESFHQQQQQQQQNQEQMEREMSHASLHSAHSVHSIGQGSDFNDAGNNSNMGDFVSAAPPPLDEGDFGSMQQGPSSDSVDAMGMSANSLENSSMQQQQPPMENVAELGEPSSAIPTPVPTPPPPVRDLRKEYLAKMREELEQKSKLEREEIDTIKEEAVAELELMRNQRKKMIDANVAKNRAEQDSMTEVMATETGWEAVASLISEENFCPVEDGHPPPTDLGKMRGLIKTLKYKKPQTV